MPSRFCIVLGIERVVFNMINEKAFQIGQNIYRQSLIEGYTSLRVSIRDLYNRLAVFNVQTHQDCKANGLPIIAL
ncbi:hypothetical protein DEO72_LG6g1813 [Vigna unguiculata]|uniref:Uncharacterized protein n=1 Tax=Vigna unguiculata TaxID=3917 RepID=A0A4D6M8F8_VIGUN|nr:hypothetical protein DEO72_LG6g1813 [Vigna unguiculata]